VYRHLAGCSGKYTDDLLAEDYRLQVRLLQGWLLAFHREQQQGEAWARTWLQGWERGEWDVEYATPVAE
jgi:hypothetical protein